MQSTVKHSGTGAWKLTNTKNRIYQVFPNTSVPVCFRTFMYDDNTNLGDVVICDVRKSDSTVVLGLGVNTSTSSAAYSYRKLWPGQSSVWSAGSVPRSAGWHRFEIYYSSGSVSYNVDNQEAYSGTCATGQIFNNAVLGNGSTSSAISGTGCFDTCAVIANPSKVTVQSNEGGAVAANMGATAFAPASGYYGTDEAVTLTANPDSGYHFVNWTSSTGALSSTNPTITYTVEAGDPTITATFARDGFPVTATACPTGAGSSTGADYYNAGSPVSLAATPNPGYNFVNWTTGGCGGTVVSTNATYDFTMPAGPVDLYANFVPVPYNLTVGACSGGTVSGSSGPVFTGTQVTVVATPNAGYWFNGWSTDSCGGTVVSRSLSYTFPMPAQSLDLHANFSAGEMVETFESYATGGTSFDSLDKNDPVGPNQAANNVGNPWWGLTAPNGRVDATKAHGGTKSLWGTAGNCRDLYNLQYRHNAGSAFTGNVYLDWWFYDPLGSTGTTSNFCGDYTALSYFAAMPTTSDYPEPIPTSMTGSQQLAVGMSDDLTASYDPTKYQVRVAGSTGSYSNGWFNTSVTRSVGWHHARVSVGPRKAGNTNDITFYIDDMANPVLPAKDSVTTVGVNAIEVNTIMPKAGSASSPTGCVYSKYFHYSSVDDLSFGSIPDGPGSAVPSSLGTNQITWSWIPIGGESGFRIWDAATAGVTKYNAGAGTTTATEVGLIANTQYSRWVDCFINRTAGSISSSRTALPPTYTLALTPVYGTSGNGAVSCNNGQGSPAVPYQIGTSTIFTAVNGFGTGVSKASKYLYIWNNTPGDSQAWTGASQWTSGTLTKTPTMGGSYYLHLRSCNGDSVANTTTLNLGPYTYQATPDLTRITDAWAYNDSVTVQITGKTVTGAFANDSFWIEETDRTAAMKIVYPTTNANWQGHAVTVVGSLSSTTRPRTLVATNVTDLGAIAPVKPLEVVLRSVGGSKFNSKTLSITNGVGLYNAGLLVKIAGKVSFADNTSPSNKFFYVDDGSSLVISDGSGKAGVKVKCGTVTAPTTGAITVTGIVSIESSPNGYVPVLIIRSAADIAAP